MSAGRVNTIPSNGDQPTSQASGPEPTTPVPAVEAARRALEELGELSVDQTLSKQQLEDIGSAYEEVIRRRAILDAKREDVKVAKKGVEAAEEVMSDKIRTYTHPEPMAPLIDIASREQDHQEMLDAAERGDDTEELSEMVEATEILPEPIEESIARGEDHL